MTQSQAGELMSGACGLIDLGSQSLNRLGATLTHEVTKAKCEILHFDSPQIPTQVLGGLVVEQLIQSVQLGAMLWPAALHNATSLPSQRGGLSALCSDILSNPTWSTVSHGELHA